MAESRSEQQWGHTCEVVAALLNTHRDPKKKPIKGSDLNPHKRRTQAPIEKVDISVLKQVFIDNHVMVA